MYFLESADCDIAPARMSVYFGGNGDIYCTIYDDTGIHGCRLCTSGGPWKEQGIRLAMSEVARQFDLLDRGIDWDARKQPFPGHVEDLVYDDSETEWAKKDKEN